MKVFIVTSLDFKLCELLFYLLTMKIKENREVEECCICGKEYALLCRHHSCIVWIFFSSHLLIL